MKGNSDERQKYDDGIRQYLKPADEHRLLEP